MRLLVVDDEGSVRDSLYEIFKDQYDIDTAQSAEEALAILEKNQFDVVITDNQMSNKTGLDLIKEAKPKNPDTAFLLLTAYATVQQAVEAIKIGADDYMIKPFDIDEIEHRVLKAKRLNEYSKRSKLFEEKSLGFERLIGESQNIKEAKTFIQKISDVESAVLILGPSGAGKEVMAQTIHETSPRKDKPFVAINCATLNEQLIESELFGHEKGSFTGATNQKLGKFELASEGTIFLDEIGEMPLDLQAKLLRVLQEKEFNRIGGNKTIKTKARVIAATNRDLQEMIKTGSFREDLYFRLNVLNFNLLPLKDRKEDIPLLVNFIWTNLSKDINRQSSLAQETVAKLSEYNFPGNIRELKNILERMMVLGPSDGEISPEFLPNDLQGASSNTAPSSSSEVSKDFDFSLGLTDLLDQIEKDILLKAMEKVGHSQVKAADLLQIKRGTLQYKLKKYQI